METVSTYTVKEVTWSGRTFVTMRKKVAFDQLSSFFGETYSKLYGEVYKNGLQSTEAPCAIYFSVDEEMKETDVAAAIPVVGHIGKIEGVEKITIPSSKVITTTHIGSYESIGPAYQALEEYLTDHQYTRSYMIEEYVIGPDAETDPSHWETNIYFVLK